MAERFIIYGRKSCPFCIYATDYCSASKQPFVFLDYDKDPSILEEYKEFYNHQTVPIILANSLETGHTRKIGGYSDLLDYVS